jgi:hypothetical protein
VAVVDADDPTAPSSEIDLRVDLARVADSPAPR